jgi:acyl dehydratase
MMPDPTGKALRPESELTPGFEFTPWRLAVEEERQQAKLGCCGIDPAIWGKYVDPSIFALLTIRIVNREGFSINGSVHMIQTYKVHSPIEIGEEIEMRGRITGIEPAPRGSLFMAEYELLRDDGSIAMELSRTSVRTDQNAERSGPGGGSGALENLDAGYESLPRIGEKQMTEAGVGNFSDDKMNRIHDDPEVAKQFGFRAPIAAGIMGSHIMMEALVKDGGGPPQQLDMMMRFRRPMFWDDLLSVTADRADGHLSRMALMKPEGKVACSASVTSVTY